MPALCASSVRARAGQRQVARDVHMRRTDLAARGQVGQRQRHIERMRHQFEHPLIETAQGGWPSKRPMWVSRQPFVRAAESRLFSMVKW